MSIDVFLKCPVHFFFFFSARTPGQGPEDHPYGGVGGARYLPHTSSSSGLARRRSTESPALSLASHQSQASSSLRLNTGSSGAAHTRRGSRGSRHRSEDLRGCSSRPRSPLPSPGTPLYTKDLGISEAGKAPTQDASDRLDNIKKKKKIPILI